MAKQNRLSLLKGYFYVLDTGCRKNFHYIWGNESEKEGIHKSRHKKVRKHLERVILL